MGLWDFGEEEDLKRKIIRWKKRICRENKKKEDRLGGSKKKIRRWKKRIYRENKKIEDGRRESVKEEDLQRK